MSKQEQSEFDALNSLTDSALDAEIKALDAEMKRYQLQIMKQQVAENKAKQEAKLNEFRSKMESLSGFLAQRKATQDMCNHRKGPMGVQAVMLRQGGSSQYSVIKHRMPNGDWWVYCTNCGKEWNRGDADYDTAIRFNTDNTPSMSTMFVIHKKEETANATR